MKKDILWKKILKIISIIILILLPSIITIIMTYVNIFYTFSHNYIWEVSFLFIFVISFITFILSIFILIKIMKEKENESLFHLFYFFISILYLFTIFFILHIDTPTTSFNNLHYKIKDNKICYQLEIKSNSKTIFYDLDPCINKNEFNKEWILKIKKKAYNKFIEIQKNKKIDSNLSFNLDYYEKK